MANTLAAARRRWPPAPCERPRPWTHKPAGWELAGVRSGADGGPNSATQRNDAMCQVLTLRPCWRDDN